MVRMNQTSQPPQEEVDTLKKDINDYVEWHMKHGPHPASVVALQELTRLLLPHVPLATRSVFTRNLTQPVVPINDIAEWQVHAGGADESGDHQDDGDLERGERNIRCRLATLYRLAGRFGLFSLPNGAFSATARVGGAKAHGASAAQAEGSRFLVAPCGVLPHELTAGAFAKVQVQLQQEADNLNSIDLRVIADGNTSMYAPRTVATFHAAFYCAAPQVRVICELRTTQTRAIAATRHGLAVTAEASRLGKIEYLEYDEAVPDAMRHAAQKTAQEELAKQLHECSERHESAERELTAARAQLDELVAQRDELALKVTVKKPKKKKHHERDQAAADDSHQDPEKADEGEAQPAAEEPEIEHHSEETAEAEKPAEDEAGAEKPAEEEAEAEKPAEDEADAEKPAEDEAEAEKPAEDADETETETNKPAEPEGETDKPAEAEGEGELEKPTEVEAEEHGETQKREASESESEEERDEEAAQRVAELDAEIEALRVKIAELEQLVAVTRNEKNAFLADYAAALLRETDRFFALRQDALVRRLSEAFHHGSTLRVFFVRSLGAIVCAGSVEQSLFAARALQSACVTTLSLGKLARSADESDGAADVADTEDDTVTIRSEDGDQLRVRSYEMEFEVLARELDAAGAQTGYTYRLPPLRAAHRTDRRPAELSEIEIPPVPLRLASSPIDGDLDDFGTPQASSKSRVEYRVTPNVYRREETDVPGSSRKLVRWVSERGSDRSATSTNYRLDTPHAAFAPPGDVRTLIANRARVRDAYYNDTVSAGPQSRFEDETEWDEAARRKDAVLSGRVDSTLVVGAASRGVLSKDALAAGGAATVYYAPNPFQQPTAGDRELRRYLKAQHVNLPTDTHFLDEREEEEHDDEEDHRPATPKRRASASAINTTTPVPIALNSVAAAAAQRATEMSERRRQSGQPQQDTAPAPAPAAAPAPAPVVATPTTSSATPAATSVKVTATPVAATPTVSASASVSPPSVSFPQQPQQPVPHATGTVQVGVAASASEPIRLTVASSSKSKTLPAGVTQEQIEAAAAEEKKEKKKGLKGLFSKKDKKK